MVNGFNVEQKLTPVELAEKEGVISFPDFLKPDAVHEELLPLNKFEKGALNAINKALEGYDYSRPTIIPKDHS